MAVRVTFAEIIVPGHMPVRQGDGWCPPLQPETEVPPDITVLELVGAHFDPQLCAWRVLARRYKDI